MIVAFHRPRELARLLEPLDDPEIDLIVVNVDNDPEVRAAAAGRATTLALPNSGFGAAVNRGVGASDRNVIAFMTDDVVIGLADLDRLAEIVRLRQAEVAVPQVVRPSGPAEATIAPLVTPRSLAREWLLLPDEPIVTLASSLHVEKWRRPRGREFIRGARTPLVVVAHDLLRLRPLPEDASLDWAEAEWFWSLASDGALIVYEPAAQCVHHAARRYLRFAEARLLAREAVRCVDRTQGPWAAALAAPVAAAWSARLLFTRSTASAPERPSPAPPSPGRP